VGAARSGLCANIETAIKEQAATVPCRSFIVQLYQSGGQSGMRDPGGLLRIPLQISPITPFLHFFAIPSISLPPDFLLSPSTFPRVPTSKQRKYGRHTYANSKQYPRCPRLYSVWMAARHLYLRAVRTGHACLDCAEFAANGESSSRSA